MRFFSRSSGESRGRWPSSRRSNSSPGLGAAGGSSSGGGGGGPADTFPNSPSVSPDTERERDDLWGTADFLRRPSIDPAAPTSYSALGIGSAGTTSSPRSAWERGSGRTRLRRPLSARGLDRMSTGGRLGVRVVRRRTKQMPDTREGFGAALAATGGRRSLEPPAVVPQGWEGGTSTNSRRASPAQSTTGSALSVVSAVSGVSAGSGSVAFSPSAVEAESEARSIRKDRRRRKPSISPSWAEASQWAANFVGLDRGTRD
ncbi:unnamed protein product, partial [Pylaiella littoralis]